VVRRTPREIGSAEASSEVECSYLQRIRETNRLSCQSSISSGWDEAAWKVFGVIPIW